MRRQKGKGRKEKESRYFALQERPSILGTTDELVLGDLQPTIFNHNILSRTFSRSLLLPLHSPHHLSTSLFLPFECSNRHEAHVSANFICTCAFERWSTVTYSQKTYTYLVVSTLSFISCSARLAPPGCLPCSSSTLRGNGTDRCEQS